MSTKMAWRVKFNGRQCFVVLFSQYGDIVDFYKEYDEEQRTFLMRWFSATEYANNIPSKVAELLNKELKIKGQYTDYIQERV